MANARTLQDALATLSRGISEVQSALEEMRVEEDALALHIFTARRHYRHLSDTKSGRRHANDARMSWVRACELGYRGDLESWALLMRAGPLRRASQ